MTVYGDGAGSEKAKRRVRPSTVDHMSKSTGTSHYYPDLVRCRGGAEAAASAAATDFRAAEAAAKSETYGPACALTVLALEESVKARIYMAIGLHHVSGAPLGFTAQRASDLVSRSHADRHSLAALQSLSDETRTRIVLGSLTQSSAPQQVKDDLARIVWLEGANQMKQQGLYSDPTSGGWSEPSQFDRSEWEDARGHVEPFLQETERQLEELRQLIVRATAPTT
jgi:AbiV family abortive infection protein